MLFDYTPIQKETQVKNPTALPKLIFFGTHHLKNILILHHPPVDTVYYRVFSPIRERADNLSLMKKTLFLHSFYEITK